MQITVAEEEGVGTRAGYYEQAGALRDMVQNHMLQLLALVAMEPPRSLDADVVRDEKLEVIRSLRPIAGAAIDAQVVRAQYAAGYELGSPVPGYREEAGVDPRVADRDVRRARRRSSTTGDGPACRSSCAPASGCRSAPARSRFTSRACRRSCSTPTIEPPLDPNVLAIRIQPDEGFSLGISSKIPGPRVRVYPVKMDFHYGSTFGNVTPEAYERLLLDVMAGDATLFMRRDNVEAAWRWVEPILDALGRARRAAAGDLRRRRLGPARGRRARGIDGAPMATAVDGRVCPRVGARRDRGDARRTLARSRARPSAHPRDDGQSRRLSRVRDPAS